MKVSIKTFTLSILMVGLTACESMTGTTETTVANASSASLHRFASGLKAVKIITSTTTNVGSFAVPTAVPAATPVPAPFPGNDGTALYQPGVQAVNFYDLDGVTSITKPSWLYDFQLGITDAPGTTGACATFGGAGSQDVAEYYRVSEKDCPNTSIANGVGSSMDPIFMRVVLNRDYTEIGSAENLLMQIEYQANGLRLNSDGPSSSTFAEDNLDQLWKIFTNSTLSFATNGNPFSVFVPPNYASCQAGGTGVGPNTGIAATDCAGNQKGAPITVKQIIIPLSASPTTSVIQLSRMKSRQSATAPYDYISSFCPNSDSPLCLGVVIRSVTLMRI